MHLSRFSALFIACAALAQEPPKPHAEIQTSLEALQPPAPLASLNLTPEEAKKVILTVGETRITAGEFDAWVEVLPEQLRGYARGPNRLKFAENLVRTKLLAAEARRRQIEEKPEYQAQLQKHAENLLAAMAFQQITKDFNIDDATMQAYFERHRSEYERVRARHILIRFAGSPMPLPAGKKELSPDEALSKVQELRKRIAAGEDFAALAKAESYDIGSAGKGGDLDWFRRRQMVPEFEEVAFALKPGQLSDPVRSPYGFHLIRVDQRESKTLEELRPELTKRLRAELGEKAVKELREKATVTFDEAFFGSGASAAASPSSSGGAPSTK
jgi:peptidyl-prolyl cis-trans isomerase C